jgi:hypothetical protein
MHSSKYRRQYRDEGRSAMSCGSVAGRKNHRVAGAVPADPVERLVRRLVERVISKRNLNASFTEAES